MKRVLSRRRFAQFGVVTLLGLAGCGDGGEEEGENEDGEDDGEAEAAEENGDDEETAEDEDALGRPADQ